MKITHPLIWEGYGVSPMAPPASSARIEVSQAIIAELDRQFLNSDLDYPNRGDDPAHAVVRHVYDDDGLHIEVGGRINISALVDAILEARSC